MQPVPQPCSICGVGSCAFFGCGPDFEIVLLCDECHAVWPPPYTQEGSGAIFPTAPGFEVGAGKNSLSHKDSRWLTAAEVADAGLGELI